jgi:hypothetical protein
MRLSPRELNLLLEDELELQRERFAPAALICSVIANVNRDSERRPEPYTAAQFMPGAKTEEDEMREFVEAIQRGDTFEVDPEQAEAFKRQMMATFGKTDGRGNIVTVDKGEAPQ